MVRMSIQAGAGGARRELALPRGDIDPVIVRRVQRRGGGGGDPGGIGAGLGCAIFCSSIAAIRSGIAHMPLPICA